MASTFKGKIRIAVEGRETVSDGPLKGVNPRELELLLDLPNGTADGSIDLAYSRRYSSIGSSTTTVLDLAGSVTDLSGSTITFAEVTTICARNLSNTDANYVLMGPDATNGFGVLASSRGFFADASDRVVLNGDYNSQDGDGGWVVLHTRGGVAVAAGSTDELAFVTGGSASNATWEVVILGRSA